MRDSQKKRLQDLLTAEMEKLGLLTGQYMDQDVGVAEMEKGYLRQALSMCLVLLKFVIQMKLDQKRGVRPAQAAGETIRNKGDRERKYLSLFGRLEFSRPSYWSDQRGMLYVVDDALSFPAVCWSYNLQELAAEGASQENFRESIKVLDALLDLGLSGTASERNVNRLGQMVDQYYEEKQVPKPEGPVCFCASFDGKGVPKIKPKDKDSRRLGKGKKRGVKQMATVSVTSWFEPKKRDQKMIIKGLMGLASDNKVETGQEQPPNDNRWHLICDTII